MEKKNFLKVGIITICGDAPGHECLHRAVAREGCGQLISMRLGKK